MTEATGQDAQGWEVDVNGCRTQIVGGVTEATKTNAVIMFHGIIGKTTNGTGVVRSMNWFKGENATNMAFDPEDDTKVYMATEDTGIRESVCEPDGTIKYWRGVGFEPSNTAWYTTKSVYWDHGENVVYSARGFASGQRRFYKLDASLPYDDAEYEFKQPNYLMYNNSSEALNKTNGNPDPENYAIDLAQERIPHGFNKVVKHPVTGRLAVGDQLSTTSSGTDWVAMPGVLFPANAESMDLGYSTGKSISAEVVGVSTDQTGTYLYIVTADGNNSGDNNRKNILRVLWDGSDPTDPALPLI